MDHHKHKHYISVLHILKNCELPQKFHFQQAIKKIISIYDNRLRVCFIKTKLRARILANNKFINLNRRLKEFGLNKFNILISKLFLNIGFTKIL